MKLTRRGFVIAGSVLAAAAVGVFRLLRPARSGAHVPVFATLESLRDERFEGAPADEAALRARLRSAGVLTADGRVDTTRIEALAASDPIVVHAGRTWTRTELDLYRLANAAANAPLR